MLSQSSNYLAFWFKAGGLLAACHLIQRKADLQSHIIGLLQRTRWYPMRIPHELGDEFPDQQPLIKRLTKSSYEFGRLAAAYDEVNRHIWRIESEDEPTTDEALEKLKKRRLLLKDDIAALLTKARRRM